MGRGHCMGRFRQSCVRIVYFLRKSTEFHVKRTECQRILLLPYRCMAPYSTIMRTIQLIFQISTVQSMDYQNPKYEQKIIRKCLRKRSGESARSRMPIFSRHILESAKPRRAIFYLSSLICTLLLKQGGIHRYLPVKSVYLTVILTLTMTGIAEREWGHFHSRNDI